MHNLLFFKHEKTSRVAATCRFQSAIRRKNEEMNEQLAKDW